MQVRIIVELLRPKEEADMKLWRSWRTSDGIVTSYTSSMFVAIK